MNVETERLLLRPLVQEDYKALCAIMQDERVMYAYVKPFTDEEVQGWLDRQIARQKEKDMGLNAVILKETGQMIGQCGLTWQPWKEETLLEVGYLFRYDAWHHGYAAEAAIACKEFAFTQLGADKVCSIIKATNTASRHVALRNGMVVIDQGIKHFRGVDMPHLLFSVSR